MTSPHANTPSTEVFVVPVATLLTGIEERFAVLIEDDDVDAEDFATFGTLLAFVRRKVLV